MSLCPTRPGSCEKGDPQRGTRPQQKPPRGPGPLLHFESLWSLRCLSPQNEAPWADQAGPAESHPARRHFLAFSTSNPARARTLSPEPRGGHKVQEQVASSALQPRQGQNGNAAVSAPQRHCRPDRPPAHSPARRTAHSEDPNSEYEKHMYNPDFLTPCWKDF